MTLSDLSRILNGSKIKNYEDVIYQRQREHLDAEANLVQTIKNEQIREILHRIIKIDNGFSTQTSFSTPGANSFYLGVASGDVNRALVNGYIIELLGTNSPNDYQNQIILQDPPIGSTRTDFVWLEVWVSELIPDKSIYDGISKPTKDTIYRFGNVLYGGTNVNDEIEDVSFGKPTANRAQIQYEIRSAANATGFSSPNVFAKDATHQFIPATDPITGEPINGLWVARNNMSMYGRYVVDENNNNLGYGYHYAIPICSVVRDDSEVSVDLNNITDLRQSIGVNFLDPDVDYTVHGLIIQNNDSDSTLIINTADPADRSRIVLKRGGLVVGTIEAFAADRVGFGNQSETEFISLDTNKNELGVNTTVTGARVHIYEDEAKRPLFIENDNTEISLDIETKQGATQALVLRNTSGSTTTNFFEIEESGQTNYRIDSDGNIFTRGGEITSLSNHLEVFAEGTSELRFGRLGGENIVFYNGSGIEIARWNNSANILELGKNSTDVTFGGGYNDTGLTVQSNGELYTDGLIQTISTNGLRSAQGKTGDQDGYLFLGLDAGSWNPYFRYDSVNDRFEANRPFYVTGTLPQNLEEIQVNYISSRSNIPGDPISIDASLTFEGYSGKKLIIKSNASDAETHVFEIQNSSGTPVAYIDEDGDLVVNDLHVNGTETVGAVTTITTDNIIADNITINDDSNFGDAATDIHTVTGIFRVRSTTLDTNWNLLVDSTEGAIAINRSSVLSPASNNNLHLVAHGGLGSLYDVSLNSTPRIWVGENFNNTNPIYGGIDWDSSSNRLFIRSKNAGSNANIIIDNANTGINNTGRTPVDKVDIEGNLVLSNADSISSDRILRFRNYFHADANNDETRLVYRAATNKFEVVKLSGGVEGASLFTWDMNTHRVGINTPTPDQTLHVHKASAGTVASNTNAVITVENNTDAWIQFLTPNSNYAGILFGDPENNSIAQVKYDHSQNSLDFWTNGAERLTILSDGHVGIGTLSSDALLRLQEESTAYIRFEPIDNNVQQEIINTTSGENAFLRIGSNSINNAGIRFGNTTTDRWLIYKKGSDSDKLTIDSATATVVTIQQDGKIGINTTAPQTLVQMQVPTTTTGGLSIYSTGAGGTPTIYLSHDAANVFGSKIYDSSTDASLHFSPRSGYNSIFDNGLVGIGTNTPLNTFYNLSSQNGMHIYGSDSRMIIEGSSSAKLDLVDSGASANQKWFVIGTNGGLTSFSANNDVATAVYTFVNFDHANGNTYFNGGKVGIGTTNPLSLFHINETTALTWAIMRLSGNSRGGEIDFYDGATIGASIYGGTSADKSLTFATNGTSVAMKILPSGYVGIGTTNPILKFVVSNAGQQGFEINENSSLIAGGIDVISYNRNTTAYAPMLFGASVYSFTQGYVGIGTTNPGQILEIVGTSPIVNIKTTSGNSSLYFSDTTSPGRIIYDHTNDSLDFWTNGIERVSIDAAGNTGIGTIAASVKLHVQNGIPTGAVAPNALYDILTIDNNDACYINLRTPNNKASGILFSDDTRAIGYIDFNHSTNVLSYIAPTYHNFNSSVRAAYDSNVASYFGRAAVGYCGQSDWASFAHLDSNSTVGYALMQDTTGQTVLNSAAGKTISFRINNTQQMYMNSTGDLYVNGGNSTQWNTVYSDYYSSSSSNPGHTHTALNMPNNQPIYWRNSSNTAWVDVIKLDNTNKLVLGLGLSPGGIIDLATSNVTAISISCFSLNATSVLTDPVKAITTDPANQAIAGFFEASGSYSADTRTNIAVYGQASNKKFNYGGRFFAISGSPAVLNVGANGEAGNSVTNNFGIHGKLLNTTGANLNSGIVGQDTNSLVTPTITGGNYAGFFSGPVEITGNLYLTKGNQVITNIVKYKTINFADIEAAANSTWTIDANHLAGYVYTSANSATILSVDLPDNCIMTSIEIVWNPNSQPLTLDFYRYTILGGSRSTVISATISSSNSGWIASSTSSFADNTVDYLTYYYALVIATAPVAVNQYIRTIRITYWTPYL